MSFSDCVGIFCIFIFNYQKQSALIRSQTNNGPQKYLTATTTTTKRMPWEDKTFSNAELKTKEKKGKIKKCFRKHKP